MLAKLELTGNLTDVWGYVDDTTGMEYVLVGFGIFSDDSTSGVYIVDVGEPATPVQVTVINSVPGFDVKVWKNFLYSVNGTHNGAGGIVDISVPEEPKVVGSFPSAHNIFIAENGFMYLESPGIRIFDLNVNPMVPQLIWSGGNEGHDATVIDDRLYDFHGTSGTNIYDVTDPAKPQLLASIVDPTIRYHHSGWPTEDGKYLFICDEGAKHPTADFTVWDIRNLNNPQKVAEFADPEAIVHNLYIKGIFAYVSYYNAGFRVFDISDPTQIILVDEFATSPFAGESFQGAFGAFPFTPSGNIYVSDITSGLHVFTFNSESSNSNNIITP